MQINIAYENAGIPFSVQHKTIPYQLQEAVYDSRFVYTNRMKKDAKLMKKRGKDMGKLVNVLSLLSSGAPLPIQHRDHQLTGKMERQEIVESEENALPGEVYLAGRFA